MRNRFGRFGIKTGVRSTAEILRARLTGARWRKMRKWRSIPNNWTRCADGMLKCLERRMPWDGGVAGSIAARGNRQDGAAFEYPSGDDCVLAGEFLDWLKLFDFMTFLRGSSHDQEARRLRSTNTRCEGLELRPLRRCLWMTGKSMCKRRASWAFMHCSFDRWHSSARSWKRWDFRFCRFLRSDGATSDGESAVTLFSSLRSHHHSCQDSRRGCCERIRSSQSHGKSIRKPAESGGCDVCGSACMGRRLPVSDGVTGGMILDLSEGRRLSMQTGAARGVGSGAIGPGLIDDVMARALTKWRRRFRRAGICGAAAGAD